MSADIGAFSPGAFSGAATVPTVGQLTQVSGSSFAIVVFDDATSRSVADNKGNTLNYTLVGTTFSGIANCSLFLCRNGVGGAGHIATASSAGGSSDIEAYLFEILSADITAALVDAISSPQWKDEVHSAATPYLSNNITSVAAGDLLVAIIATVTHSGTETLTWNNSFTQVVADGDSTHFSSGIGKRVNVAAGTYNSSVSSAGGGTDEAISMVVAFKSAAAGPPANTAPVAWIV